MKKLLFILIFIPCLFLNAQNGVLKGRVITGEKEVLEGVNIIISGTQYGASSREDGSFEINNLPYGFYSLEVSLIGYAKKKYEIEFTSSTEPLTIILSEEAIQGKQIVVSASKYEQKIEDLPVSTTLIQHDFINKNNYQTFDEMLRNVPGIQMNLEQPSIRGSSGYSKGTGARVLIAVNGIPMYSGDTGEIIWELIPISDVERIEIIKGPSSSLYGSSAIGGVINIITKSSAKNPITHVQSYFGAYDKPAHDIWKWNNNLRTFYGLSVTHSNSIGNLGYTLSFKKFDNMSYRQNDYAKRYLGYLKLNYTFSDQNDLTFFADYLNMDRGNFLYWKDSRNALVPKDEDNGNTVKSNRLFTGLIFNHHFNKDFTAQIKSSYYYTKFDGYGLELTESIANLFRNEAIINANLSTDWTITSGAEISFSKVSSNIFRNPNFFGMGAYFQGEYKGIEKLIASFGIRFDYMKLDSVSGANAVTPKVGLNYKLTKDIILRASFGTGFRAPTPAEVFTTTSLTGGLSIKGNTNLTAETSVSGEAGVRYNISSKTNIDLALFVTSYKNYIEANLVSDGIQFLNVPEARVQGIEIGTDIEIIPELVKANAGYTYLWARNLTDNKTLKYRPRHSLYAKLQFTPAPFEASISFRYASRVEEIDDLIAKPPLAIVTEGDLRVPVYDTDVSVGYNFLLGAIPTKIYLNAKNIFNYNYVEFIGNIAPIRNYSISWELFF
jgi:outer membrane receptor for ferrienterochelin and colicins